MGQGYWDIHNHILPGVDDGACCMEETYELLAAEYEQGVRNIVFTPHFRPDMFTVPAAEREEVYRLVCGSVHKKFPDMSFYLGCEFHAHEGMMDELSDARCRMAGTNVVLLEFSTVSSFRFMGSGVRDLLDSGYRPILAHVERYRCLYEDDSRIIKLKQMGAMIQINADSVPGKTGRIRGVFGKKDSTRIDFCGNLLNSDLVDFIGSDAHDPRVRPVRIGACMEKMKKVFGEERVEKIFRKNPSLLLG